MWRGLSAREGSWFGRSAAPLPSNPPQRRGIYRHLHQHYTSFVYLGIDLVMTAEESKPAQQCLPDQDHYQ